MKKSLLLASFAVLATVVSAQTTVCMTDTTALKEAGLSLSAKTEIEGGTVLLDNEIGSFALAYKDSWGATNLGKTYKTVKVGDSEEIKLTDYKAAVGNTNPTFVSYEEGVMSAGAVFLMTAKKDGWMTVFTGINPNKQYVVFENKTGALPYTLGVAGKDYKINYALPVQTTGEDAGYIDFNAPDASKYFIMAQKQSVNEAGEPLWYNKDGEIVAGDRPVWQEEDGTNEDGTIKYKDVQGKAVMEDVPGQNKPQFPYLVAGLEKAPGEGTGFVTFNVLAGNDYYFSALGSKCACAGFIFTESDEEPVVTYCATDELPEVVFATGAAVESVAAAAEENAPIYNMMGVRVNSDAKGILIQNGKKFIRK